MYLAFWIIFFSCCQIVCHAFSLGDKLQKAEKGDYVVTEQDNIYSLLIVRDMNSESIVLEEICIPVSQKQNKNDSWKEWLSSGAPGHTSWVLYEIDLHTYALIEGYSFSKRGWLFLDKSTHFLATLLSLPLQKVPSAERRKIGPSPKQEDPDHRPVWNPPLFVQGEKQKQPLDAWKTVWPKDDSLLSSCKIILYFSEKIPLTFPCWIEASNGHYTYAIKAIDSGKRIVSPLSISMPRRPPQILKPLQRLEQTVRLSIKSPSYYKHFSLFVFDLIHPNEQLGPIPFTLKEGSSSEDFFLDISIQNLEKFLTKDHRYKWILVPQSSNGFLVESEDFFLWPSLMLK